MSDFDERAITLEIQKEKDAREKLERDKTKAIKAGKPTDALDEQIRDETFQIKGKEEALAAVKVGRKIGDIIKTEEDQLTLDRTARDAAAAGPAKQALNDRVAEEEQKITGKKTAQKLIQEPMLVQVEPLLLEFAIRDGDGRALVTASFSIPVAGDAGEPVFLSEEAREAIEQEALALELPELPTTVGKGNHKQRRPRPIPA